MREELMRRISLALDGDGVASDAELQKELREDPEAAKYAKDLTRVNKWLATWPLPEPDDAAFEALALRIEQRLDAPLPAVADVTAPPMFEDDDSLRDATAGLLESGEYRVSQLQGEPPPEISAASKPASPIARVLLKKEAARGIVEEGSGEMSGEPLSAADLELRLSLDPKPKKKKKAPPAVPAAAAPIASVEREDDAPKAKKKAKSATGPSRGDRVSIPTPAAPLVGSLAPVTELKAPKEKERPSSSAWWAFAAAACVGLGVFGAATMLQTSDSAPSMAAIEESSAATPVSATTTLVPTTAQPESVSPALAAGPVVPPAVAPAPPPPTVPVDPDVAMPEQPMYSDQLGTRMRRGSPSGAGTATTEPLAASGPRHAAIADDLDQAPAPLRSSPSTRTARATAGPEPAPTPSAPTTPTIASAAPEDLPEAPDRATIQAVLQGVEPAVRACGGDEHGTADVDVVIASSGRVTTATVHGPFAGTPIGSCIARAVRSARFPAFAQPRFQVTYPFSL